MDYRRRFPNVELNLVDGSGDHLMADVRSTEIDIAFVAGDGARWQDRVLPVWSERVVIALPDNHILSAREIVRWSDLDDGTMLLPQRGPGRELCALLMGRLGCPKPNKIIHHDVGLDRLLTLVGAGWGNLLALEGATGASYAGVTFREVHDVNGPTRLNFRALWRGANCNPSLQPFLDILLERYPAI